MSGGTSYKYLFKEAATLSHCNDFSALTY